MFSFKTQQNFKKEREFSSRPKSNPSSPYSDFSGAVITSVFKVEPLH